MFAEDGNNKDVVFADVNLKEAPIRGEPYNPGKGGWPTIRYFNKETGVEGAPYKKKTETSMCNELGNRNNMIDYIEEYGNTVLCGVGGENCNEKELVYLQEMKDAGLEGQQALDTTQLNEALNSKEGEDHEWAIRRLRILNKLMKPASAGGSPQNDEL